MSKTASKNKELTPANLRVILSIVLIVLMVIGVVIFWFGLRQIQGVAIETKEAASKAEAGKTKVQVLLNTSANLKKHADAVNRASAIVAESQSYVYQDQIIKDINMYASRAGIKIGDISFSSASSGTIGSTAAPSGTATPKAQPGATGTSSGTNGTSLPAGINMTTANVSISGPIPYINFLKFINLIEKSLFKMSIPSLEISRQSSESGGTDTVAIGSLVIEVYVRQGAQVP